MMFSRRLSEVGMATRRARTFSERHNHTSYLPMSSCCFRKQISIVHARSECVFIYSCFTNAYIRMRRPAEVRKRRNVKKIDAAGLQTRLLRQGGPWPRRVEFKEGLCDQSKDGSPWRCWACRPPTCRGASEPTIIPITLARKPANCGGSKAVPSGSQISMGSQTARPRAIER